MRVVTFQPGSIVKIKSMADFYRDTGLLPEMQEGALKDVRQIWMNHDQCLELEGIVFKNLKKDRYYKTFKDHYLKSIIAMDWLCYAPTSDEDIPRDTLYVYDDMDEADKAMEAYREKKKEKENVADNSN